MNDGVAHPYSIPAWSPYLVGALIGLLAGGLLHRSDYGSGAQGLVSA